MSRIFAVLAVCAAGLLGAAQPAGATFHVIVIDQVFAGFAEAPDAQYVMLRMELGVQTNVHGQTVPIYDAAGAVGTPFATFCSLPSHCNLPTVSPACSSGGCPSPVEASGARVLIATARARDLFCITPDLLATGTLPFPDGRVCWSADCRPFCTTGGPVDCVAYGAFPAADNGIFGQPAVAPVFGEALVGSPARQSQFNGGNLLDDAAGFSLGPPTPENFHSDLGSAGVPGDSQGTGMLDRTAVDAEVSVVFQFDRRCAAALAPNRRGADANLDARISAADLIATIRIVSAAAAL